MTDAHRTHTYSATIRWTGDRGTGTSGYRDYDRRYDVEVTGKPTIAGSSDPLYRGDPSRHNPEDLLITAVSACHMLWYLHLCADAGVIVTAYVDDCTGELAEAADGSGRMTGITLRPTVTITAGSDPGRAAALHADAARMCPIAASMAFPVRHEPSIIVG
ncbi:MAG TPA: OsmC family protein [Thermomicrobiales bacterium]|jgi:organic hydroperoxide reductase OsmC/OhrA|nr:OsmC family protein [Thermomicrobiales bacterium]